MTVLRFLERETARDFQKSTKYWEKSL